AAVLIRAMPAAASAASRSRIVISSSRVSGQREHSDKTLAPRNRPLGDRALTRGRPDGGLRCPLAGRTGGSGGLLRRGAVVGRGEPRFPGRWRPVFGGTATSWCSSLYAAVCANPGDRWRWSGTRDRAGSVPRPGGDRACLRAGPRGDRGAGGALRGGRLRPAANRPAGQGVAGGPPRGRARGGGGCRSRGGRP